MLHTKREAFTMIELVFVIVVLGILAAVAIPKFAATRTDAEISKGRADISSIRSAIMTERQSRLIKGDNKFIEAGAGTGKLDKDYTSTNKVLFGGVLTYGIKDSTNSGHWHLVSHVDANASKYNFYVGSTPVEFTYTRGTGVFDCTDQTATYCSDLTD